MNWLQQIFSWIGKLRCWFIVSPWESALRIRLGKEIREFGPGWHFQIPIADVTFIQSSRLRVLNLPIQTVTSKSGNTVTISVVVRWRMTNIRDMYQSLHTPEDWINNVALAATAVAVYETAAPDPASITQAAIRELVNASRYGVTVDGIDVTDLSRVRTYRLITGEGNSGWTWTRMGNLEMPRGPML